MKETNLENRTRQSENETRSAGRREQDVEDRGNLPLIEYQEIPVQEVIVLG